MATLIERGIAPDAQPAARPATDGPVSVAFDGDSAGQVGQAALAASVACIVRCDARLRLGLDGEAVHDARVAVRRIRSELRALRGVFERSWADGLRRRLRLLSDVLGEARDADVLTARLERDIQLLAESDRARAGEVLVLLREGRTAAYERLGATLRDEEYVATIAALVDAAGRPVFGTRATERARDVVPALMKRAWRALRRAVRERSKPPADAELHRIRIEAKQVRYAAESLAAVAGKRARRFAAHVARLQEALGEQHDAAAASQRLRGLAGAAGVAFAAGELAALERVADLRARRGWRKTWRAASRRKRRFWRP